MGLGVGLKKYSAFCPMVGTRGSMSSDKDALSHATTASMRSSLLPTSVTAEAPNECPARPRRDSSTSPLSGLSSDRKNDRASSVPS